MNDTPPNDSHAVSPDTRPRRLTGLLAIAFAIAAVALLAYFLVGRARPAAPESPELSVAPEPPPTADDASQGEEFPALERVTAPRAPDTVVPRSIVDLQSARRSSTEDVDWPSGRVRIELTDLQPNVGAWYLVTVRPQSGAPWSRHLRATDALRGRIRLDPTYADGLILDRAQGPQRCSLWPDGDTTALAPSDRAFTPLCEGALFLLTQVDGHRTSKEWVTDFLRDRVAGGEQLTTFVKEEILKDAYLQNAELERASSQAAERERPPGSPAAGNLDPKVVDAAFDPELLGLTLDVDGGGSILVGRWYPVKNHAGVFAAGVTPGWVRAPGPSPPTQIAPLDEVERNALTYLVAFDLEKLDLGFTLGTDHPRVGWSERAQPAVRVGAIPGPDGFADASPLVRAGRLRPDAVPRVVATFVGGFKRTHGAFRTGALSAVHRGTHYGFIEEGVVFSSLEDGLATLLVETSGTVRLETWSADNDSDLGDIRFARQNGVPLVERDANGRGIPGSLITRWADGNWSGSQDRKFRTLRSGVCLQDSEAGRFLIYGYFSSVTPSAMARVFLAYDCDYALMLDMNALEHSYLAVYDRTASGGWLVQHVVEGMEVLDQTYQGQVVPRFVAYPDNRDFFYLTRKESP